MNKTLRVGMVFGALAAGFLSSPALARVDTQQLAAQCRERAYAMWQRGRMGDGLDRAREFVFNSCMADGQR